jgi:hypothetical protein
MKKNMIRFVALFGFVFALSAVNALAQSQPVLKASIPFDFSAANRTLPAGDYTVSNTNAVGGTIVVRRDDGEKAVVLITRPHYAENQGKQAMLVFRRYGDQYFLAKVISMGDSTGREIPMSKTEKRLTRDMDRHLANNKVEPEIVTIITRLQ